MVLVLVWLLLALCGLKNTDALAQSVGICYGKYGDNLPSRQEVVDLFNGYGIIKMRVYYPDQEALEALRGSDIELILDVGKENLGTLTDAATASNFVKQYVTDYSDVKIKYITVGNEVHPNDIEAQYILPAMTNIQNSISSTQAQAQINVSLAIGASLLTDTYPPENGRFNDDASPYIKPIIDLLVKNRSPLLVNLYPYFAYANNQKDITLDYALFTQQGNNNVGYQNLFDAMLDATYAALEKMGGSSLKIVVFESGWPSEGGAGASVQNAAQYYGNLINHVKNGNGTPRRPCGPIEAYLFALFDENQKPGVEPSGISVFSILTNHRNTKFTYDDI